MREEAVPTPGAPGIRGRRLSPHFFLGESNFRTSR